MSTARTMTAGAVTPTVPVASEAVARWVWPGLVIGLLGIQVGMGVVAVTLATGDPAWRVVPHYHDRAIHWDRVAAARTASDQLGWKSAVTIGRSADVYGHRDLVVELRDAIGQPVTGAQVTGELWHHGHPGELIQAVCRESPDVPGRYIGRAKVNRSGLWQVELNANRNGERFVQAAEMEWRF
jgi:hypothetical protein